MDYNHIKDYLDKFRDILFSKEEKNKIILDVINRTLSINIGTKDIQVRPPYIYVKASPFVRNEILINKEKILKEILIISPEINIKDIK